jgi:hypothetical protein
MTTALGEEAQMKLSTLLLLCGPMLLSTAACTKVCAAQVREVYVQPISGGMGGMTQLVTQPQNLQGTLQATTLTANLDTAQLGSTAPPDIGNSSGSLAVATQNPAIDYQVVPPPPPEEPIEVHHNEEDC